MSRRLFAGSIAATAILGTVVGSAFAWPAGDSAVSTTSVGSNSAVVFITDVSGLIGPNGGPPAHVANVVVKNTGSFALQIDSATVTPTSVDSEGPNLGDGPCLPAHFTGQATDLPTSPFGPPPPAAFSDPEFKAKIAANFGAPADCQGDDVHYTVTVYLSNP